MVVINRMKYPEFSIHCETSFFPSRLSFLQWEAANELKVLLSKAKRIDEMKAEHVAAASSFDLRSRVNRLVSRLTDAARIFVDDILMCVFY
jgi:hypothetical protein